MHNVCICGGGSQGHISAGMIGSVLPGNVHVLTRRPALWSRDFTAVDMDGKEYKATLGTISSDPGEVIPLADIVLVCLPGYAIREELELIRPHIRPHQLLGCVFGGSGFFIAVRKVFGPLQKAFALQRVPFTGRVREYGHSANVKGYKPYLKVGTMNIDDPAGLAAEIEKWYRTPVSPLRHWLDATLSNSNPLLHPCRMSVMFKDWEPGKVYPRIPWMYNTDWDDESSRCWLDCDEELGRIIERLPASREEIPSILEYYGCTDVPSLTAKMQSIRPFLTVQAHMDEVPGGFAIDPTVRYFTEDIPFGIVMIKSFAEYVGVETPHIDRVISWAQPIMGKEYLVGNRLTGKDIGEACVFEGDL